MKSYQLLILSLVSLSVEGQVIPNTPCDTAPDALSRQYGVTIPRSCVDSRHGHRCYYTYIPDCAGADSPLVFDIHGYDSCPLYSSSYTGWKSLADKECFVVVWPIGNIHEKCTESSCWAVPAGLKAFKLSPELETYSCCCFSSTDMNTETRSVKSKDTDDLIFLRYVASHAVKNVPALTGGIVTINEKRIYMGGHSNGCMTALAMAMQESDVVAAVCCHAGVLLTPPTNAYTPTPIWLVHGEKDPILPYQGISLNNHDVMFPGQQVAYDYLRELNGCQEFETTNDNVKMIQKSKNCTNNVAVELVSLHEGDHVPYANVHNIDMPMDTTAAAWEFCSKYENTVDPYLVDVPLQPQSSDTLNSALERLRSSFLGS